MTTEVCLTPAEMLSGAIVGIMRQVENLKLERYPTHGAKATMLWQIHVEGALGEIALAKYLGVYWTGKGGLREPDVGVVDVRTRSKHHYELILHENDPSDRKFYLLTGSYGKYKVHGWIMGKEGKNPDFWGDPAGGRAAYFVPHSALNQ